MNTENANTPEPRGETQDLSRREFIKTGAIAAGAAAAATAGCAQAQSSIVKNIAPASVIGANERIRTGHIGLGGMGKRDLAFALRQPELEPIAMCDLIEDYRNQGADLTENNYKRPTTHEHFEEIIEDRKSVV